MQVASATLSCMNTTTLLILALLSIPVLGDGLDDLCDIVNPDTGVPLRCELHPEGAPVYDGAVCCDGASCQASQGGGCPDSLEPYYCDLGEVLASEEVACYVEVPDYCDVFPCSPGYQAQPQSNMMCCSQGVCWHFNHGDDCELGDIFWCQDGVSNPDGTITCLD